MIRSKPVRILFVFMVFFLFRLYNVYGEEQKDNFNSADSKDNIPINCTADYMEYFWKDGKLYARGNVKLKYHEMAMESDKLNADSKTNDVEAEGHIILDEKEYKMKGSSAHYNLQTKKGYVENVEFSSKPWTYHGSKITKTSEKEANLNGCEITTCNITEGTPHYHLSTGKMYIDMDNKIEAWHVLFYVGSIPIFYFPYFSKSLKDDKSPVSIRPGYSSTEGFYLKGSYGYYFDPLLHGNIFLDYFTKKGIGFGIEPRYVIGNNRGEGRVYTYYIRDHSTLTDRWRLDLEHNHKITDDISAVANLNFTSDESISSDLYSMPTVLRAQRSFLAVTKNDPNYTVTISAERGDYWDPIDGKYKKNYEQLPKASFRTSTMQIGESDLYYSVGSEFQRSYTISNDYYILMSRLDPTISHSWNVSYFTNLNTTFAFHEVWQDRADLNSNNDGFVHSYDFINSLHHRWNQFFETTLTHTFSQRLNKFENDPYRGIDSNKLGVAAFFRIDRLVFEASTGYDFRSTSEFWKRFDFIFMDLRAEPLKNVSYYLNTAYDIPASEIVSVDTFLRTNLSEKMSLSFGLVSQPRANVLDISSEIGTDITEDLRVSVGVKYDTINALFKEQNFGFHYNITDCWMADITVHKFMRDTKFWLDLRLRAFPSSGIGTDSSSVGFSL